MSDVTLLQRLVQLRLKKESQEQLLKLTEKELAAVQEAVQEQFLTDGTLKQVIEVNGLRWTVYLQQQCRAYVPVAAQPGVCAALKALGYGDLVAERVNLNSLSAWVRERKAMGEEIPAISGLEVRDYPEARVRRG